MEVTKKEIRAFHFEKICRTLLVIASVMVVAAIGIYGFTPGTNSDQVEGLFWSDAVLQGGRLLNPDYIYPYAIPFGSNLLFLPFVAILGTTQLANSLGMLLFFLIMAGTAVFFMKTVINDPVRVAVGSALILLAFRSQMGMNLLHHILFYQLGFVCFLGMAAAVLRIIGQRGEKRRYIVLLAVYTAWSSANGLVTVVLAAFPVLAAVILLEVAGRFPRKKTAKLLILIVASLLIGYALYAFSLRGIVETGYVEEVGSGSFLSISGWLENIYALPDDWINLFFTLNSDGVNIASVSGAEIVVTILIAVAATFIPVYYIVRFRKLDDSELMIFCASVLIWGICIAQYVFLRGREPRLLYNGICVDFVLLALLVKRIGVKTWERKIICLLAAGMIAAFAVLFPLKENWKADTVLTDAMEQRGLTYGFATFWNAGINTANSGGRVKVRPVVIQEGGTIVPCLFQSQFSWYEISEDLKDWFLILTDEEYQEVLGGANKVWVDSCEETFDIQNYHVFVYSSEMWDELLLS